VSGLMMRLAWPLAIMPSADQVPVKTSHSIMLWHKWVVLISGSTDLHYVLLVLSNLHITSADRRDLVYRARAAGSL
jgi:hypothetical protein